MNRSIVSASTLQELISSFISLLYLISRAWNNFRFLSRPHLKEKKDKKFEMKNYNSKREELEEEDQGEDERNVKTTEIKRR